MRNIKIGLQEIPYEDKIVINKLIFEGKEKDIREIYDFIRGINNDIGCISLNRVIPTPSLQRFLNSENDRILWRFKEWGCDREAVSIIVDNEVYQQKKKGVIFFASYMNAPKKVVDVLIKLFPNVIFLYSFCASNTEYGMEILYYKGEVEREKTFFKGSRMWNKILNNIYEKNSIPKYFK